MLFSDFAIYLEKLSSTSKRLEITQILSDLITNLDEAETANAMYLSLGYLKAPYESPKFNIAEKMMVRALAVAYELDAEDILKDYAVKGDLGDVAEVLTATNTVSPNTINQVHSMLLDIALLSGSGSQDAKITALVKLLKSLDNVSAKYVIRIILGMVRLGFSELTVIDALIQAHQGALEKKDKKDLKKAVEYKYNVHPDIGRIAQLLKTDGLAGIKNIDIEVGVPIKAQRAQRIGTFKEIMDRMGTGWAEFKFDGTRVQLHLDRHKKLPQTDSSQNTLFETTNDQVFVKTFTRNLEDSTHQFPDLTSAATTDISAQSIILDGEAVGYDKKTGEFLPFQEIMQRKRKHDIAEMVKEIPLKYFVFDILYLNGKPLTNETLRKRKEILKTVVKPSDVIIVDEYLEAKDSDDLIKYFELARDKGLEGLIVKNPEAIYEAGARSYTWVKFKVADTKLLEDSVDCVLLGYYFGRGTRAQYGIGGFLVGVYDPKTDTYKTITKVGTGLKEHDWIHLKTLADTIKTNEKPQNFDVEKIYTPDVWTLPKIVVELGADEISKSTTHSAHYALRFPRLLKFREDKGPTDITTISEIADLHQMQKRGYY